MFAKIKNSSTIALIVFVVLLHSIPFLSSCTFTENDVGALNDDEPIKFLVEDAEMDFTRGKYQTAKQIETYSIYSFYRNRAYVSDAVQTKVDGAWKSSRTITFPGKNALDFFALKPGFVRDDVQNLTMTGDEKSFVHKLPNENAKQEDFMCSSLLQRTKEGTKNGVLTFKFKHMFAYLRFAGKCSVDGLYVEVHSFTIHNIRSTGKFTYSTEKEGTGTWELQDDLDNYKYLMPADKELTNKNVVLHTTDSLLFVMAQTPSVFAISDNTSFADADAQGKAYLEVECRVWKMEDDGVTPQYIGCSATTWANVYFPLSATTKWQTNSNPFGGTFNVMFDYTGGYTYEGEDFLKKHTNGAMTMVSIEPIQSFLVTNPWEDDDYNSQTLEMK
ncbi:Fimbrillin-like [Prevotellaceae bacterium HUN156]|nr:Fimbrillin-like [Prevotellaceae bacterium HUN156]